MPLKIIDRYTTPPGGFRYTQPETGVSFNELAWNDLLYKVKQHRVANDLPIGLLFKEEIECQVCKNSPDACEETGNDLMSKAVRLASALKRWAESGMKTVTTEELDKRREICGACKFWRGEGNIGLGSCARCGCTGLKLYLPTERCPDGKWETTQ